MELRYEETTYLSNILFRVETEIRVLPPPTLASAMFNFYRRVLALREEIGEVVDGTRQVQYGGSKGGGVETDRSDVIYVVSIYLLSSMWRTYQHR